MLYGHKEMVDNRIGTIVSSATTVEEYGEFIAIVVNQSKKTRNFNEVFTSKALQHMMEEMYSGFKKPVHVFYHDDEAQRDAFFKEWKIEEVNNVQARDKQGDMVFDEKYRRENAEKQTRDAAMEAAEKAGVDYTGDREPTLAEKFGLTENDPWDRRSEADRERDEEMRQHMKRAKEAGTMSDDSFDAPAPKRGAEPDVMQAPGQSAPGNGILKITDIDGLTNPDGTINIDNISNIRASKTGGPVDENLKAEREKQFEEKKAEKLDGRPTFSPEDFAKVLAGNGGSIPGRTEGDNSIDNGAKPVDLSGLSEEAEKARTEQKNREKSAMDQTRQENDLKAKQERDQGVFRGADLFGEDEIELSEMPDELRNELVQIGALDNTMPIKDYPFNSQVGNKALLPFSQYGKIMQGGSKQGGMITTIAGTVNVNIEGTMSMGETSVAVVSRKDIHREGYVVFQRTGGALGSTITTSIVRIR